MIELVEISEIQIPRNVRFDTPRRNQGQIIEESYGSTGRGEADSCDPYLRIIDRSTPGHVKFFAKTDAPLRVNVWVLADGSRDVEASEMIDILVRAGRTKKSAETKITESIVGTRICAAGETYRRVI